MVPDWTLYEIFDYHTQLKHTGDIADLFRMILNRDLFKIVDMKSDYMHKVIVIYYEKRQK